MGQGGAPGAGRGRAARLHLQVTGGPLAHPRTEHFAPLFVTMGAADAAGELGEQKSVIDGFWMGLAKRSVQFG